MTWHLLTLSQTAGDRLAGGAEAVEPLLQGQIYPGRLADQLRCGAGREARMSCVNHVLNLRFEHHSWLRRVTGTETVPARETTMWGNGTNATYVRCHAEHVCRDCGEIREEGNCLCDKEVADHCPARLAWLAQTNSDT